MECFDGIHLSSKNAIKIYFSPFANCFVLTRKCSGIVCDQPDGYIIFQHLAIYSTKNMPKQVGPILINPNSQKLLKTFKNVDKSHYTVNAAKTVDNYVVDL